MTHITAIRVDDEENIGVNLTDRLDSNLSIFSTIVLSLQCGTQENAGGIFEAEASFVESTAALGFVPLKEHCALYALSVVGQQWTGLERA